MSLFKTRLQAIGFLAVSVLVASGCVASIVVAELFMPDNAAGQEGVATFYRCFTPLLVVWSLLGIAAFLAMPAKPHHGCSEE